MSLVRATVTLGILALSSSLGCAHVDTYPPALPVPKEEHQASLVPAPVVTEPPAMAVLPPEEEWPLWTPYSPPVPPTCTGQGQKRTATATRPSAVDTANTGAVVQPTAQHTAGGTSVQTRYPYDRQKERLYEVHTSPSEATYILLPQEERLAAKVLLNPEAWEVTYGKSGAEGARREVVALRPVQAPQTARALLVLDSGLTIHLKLLAHTKPGMLSVTWDIPARLTPPTSATLPVEQRPPQFERAHAYAGYTFEADANPTRTPPWLPEAVLDDGRNTLLKFRGTLEGARLPVVSGVQQHGRLALVHSRWYVRPEHGAWLYVQGVHPALHLQDAQGLRVRVVRQGPPAAVAER